MRTFIFLSILTAALFFISACDDEEKTEALVPKISIIIPTMDTVSLNTNYTERGAEVFDAIYGRLKPKMANITGQVNTSIAGTYFIDYDYTDENGNRAATVTRTVAVVENKAIILNGQYNVACSCTTNISGSKNPTITTENYTAMVTPGNLNRSFQVSEMKLGSEQIKPFTTLQGDSIVVNYYSPVYQNSRKKMGYGILSASKDTFTIITEASPNFSSIKYLCKNIYSKKLATIKIKNNN